MTQPYSRYFQLHQPTSYDTLFLCSSIHQPDRNPRAGKAWRIVLDRVSGCVSLLIRFSFLVTCTRLYTPLSLSVGQSVRRPHFTFRRFCGLWPYCSCPNAPMTSLDRGSRVSGLVLFSFLAFSPPPSKKKPMQATRSNNTRPMEAWRNHAYLQSCLSYPMLIQQVTIAHIHRPPASAQ